MMTEQPFQSKSMIPLSARQDWCWSWVRCYPEPYPRSPNLMCWFALRVHGRLDVGALKQAVLVMNTKHESLRMTSHLADDGTLWQAVEPHAQPLDVVHSTGGVDPSEFTSRMLGEELIEVPGRMSDATLARMSGDDHLLIVRFHHLVTDAMSIHHYRRELARIYRELVINGASPDVECAFSYRRFVLAENGPGAKSGLDRRIAAWAGTLRDHGASVPLPRAGDTAAQRNYGHVPIALSASVTEQILAKSRSFRVPLLATLAGALGRAIGKIYDRNRIIVSTHYHGRNRAELDTALGLFVNVINIPIDLECADLGELLTRVRRSLSEATQTVDLPLSKLYEAVIGGSGHNRYFPYSLSHVWLRLDGVSGWWPTPAPADGRDWPDLEVQRIGPGAPPATGHIVHPAAVGAGQALVVGMEMDGVLLRGTVKYETNIYSAQLVREVVAAFVSELDAICRWDRAERTGR
ncbi:condensation domain-containing protein [Nocardia sp. NPDC050435]|uniref:condensation domain-containing protein n=1 Tax=Nocardia sp. NPDC050435 TaxID=3155040 RepID=UPI0033DFB838